MPGDHERFASILPLPVPAEFALPAPPPLTTRIKLAVGPERRGALDGGWWPHSREAVTELTGLAETLGGSLGTVTHLIVDFDDWDDVPPQITAGGRTVAVGRLSDLHNLIVVTLGVADDYLLLVVPPEAPEPAALTALSRAADGIDSRRPQEILATCDISTVRRRTPGPARPPVLRLIRDAQYAQDGQYAQDAQHAQDLRARPSRPR
ncbi:DUF5994 family protein [Spirillospora sp. NPDC048911]|uniref:DUF5994 family protein n=1 Tax=Spirillospora sp. NPDC048911 TaxID=3364527 RepID=UPI0037106F23